MNNLIFNKFNLNILNLNLLICLIIPINLGKSYDYIYDIKLIISLLLTSIIFSFILFTFSSCLKVLGKWNLYSIFTSIISFSLVWIFFTGNFFPISGLSGQFLNLDLPIRLRFIILIKTILIFLFYLFLTKKDKNYVFFKFISFFVLIQLIFIIFSIQKISNINTEKKLNNFGKKNLIVLSFDGISGGKIYNEISKNIFFKDAIKDFKLYKNTLTGAPFTTPSINIEINGTYEENLTQNILNNKNIDVRVYNTYNSALINRDKGVYKGEFKKYNLAFRVNNFFQNYGAGAVGRWASPVGVILINPIFDKKIYKSFINFITFFDESKINPFNYINRTNKVDLYEYDNIFNEIIYDKNLEKVIRMFHFTFSHWPISLNENCEEITFFENQIKSYFHEEVMLKCISKKIIFFLNNLKKKDLYDNSMIVIKSDHAKPNCIETHHTKYTISEFFKPRKCNKHYNEYPLTEKLNNHFYYGVGRYKTFILIKDRQKINQEIEISDKQVFLHDLSVTYCSFFFNFDECNILDRNNLILSEDEFKINSYDMYFTKPEFPLSTTDFSKLKKYQMTSDQNFLEFLRFNQFIN